MSRIVRWRRVEGERLWASRQEETDELQQGNGSVQQHGEEEQGQEGEEDKKE